MFSWYKSDLNWSLFFKKDFVFYYKMDYLKHPQNSFWIHYIQRVNVCHTEMKDCLSYMVHLIYIISQFKADISADGSTVSLFPATAFLFKGSRSKSSFRKQKCSVYGLLDSNKNTSLELGFRMGGMH